MPVVSAHALPKRGEAHVWVGDGQLSELDQDLELLSGYETNRSAKFFSPEDRRRYVSAWAAVRRVLAGYLDTGPRAILFRSGGPEDPDSRNHSRLMVELSAPRVCLSVARSEDLWLLGLALDDPIGVDLEHIRTFDTEGLVNRCLAQQEQRQVRVLSGEARDTAFIRAWTRKQAVMKAAGLPLATQPHQVVVHPGRKSPIRAELSQDRRHALGSWTVQDMPPVQSALAAVARPASCTGLVTWYDCTAGNTLASISLSRTTNS